MPLTSLPEEHRQEVSLRGESWLDERLPGELWNELLWLDELRLEEP